MMTHSATPPARELALWAVTVAAVWVTVGWVAALVVFGLLVGDRVVRRGDHVLATAAVILMMCVPIVWFLASSLPLWPPSARLNDNVLAHHVGGMAVWTLFLAACVEVLSREGDSP